MLFFRPNINSNWPNMILIKIVTNQPLIRHIFKSFNILSTLSTYCLIFLALHPNLSHVTQFFNRLPNPPAYRLHHDNWSFSMIFDPSGMIIEPLAQCPFFNTLINPLTRCLMFNMILFWHNVQISSSTFSRLVVQVYNWSNFYIIYLEYIIVHQIHH